MLLFYTVDVILSLSYDDTKHSFSMTFRCFVRAAVRSVSLFDLDKIATKTLFIENGSHPE